ncbi:unnamed protein product [Orchesella dallaii]|uniref:Odorant receptor n=1 Tax=Orchesella dallaii TaxID=48710 RepID=A0ABP1REH2_9HEXA
MLIHENFLQFCKLNLKQQGKIWTAHIKFITTKEGDQLVVRPTTKQKSTYVKLLVSFLFVSILWLQIFQQMGNEELLTTLQSMLYATPTLSNVVLRMVYLKQNYFVANLFNMFLNYERNLKDENKYWPLNRSQKYLIQFVQLNVILGPLTIAIGYSLQRWLSPCNSALFGFNFIPECMESSRGLESSWTFVSLAQLTLQIIISAWLITDVVGEGVFLIMHMSYVQSCCFKQYTVCFRNNLKTKFDLQKLLRYRQLQILVRGYNWIQQGLVIFMPITVGPYIFVKGVYGLIYLGSSTEAISFPDILVFGTSFFGGFVIILLITGAYAGVHSESTATLKFIRQRVLFKLIGSPNAYQIKIIIKYVKSFSPLQVNVGATNYVEKFTPIVLLDFSVAQIVNLLLLG